MGKEEVAAGKALLVPSAPAALPAKRKRGVVALNKVELVSDVTMKPMTAPPMAAKHSCQRRSGHKDRKGK